MPHATLCHVYSVCADAAEEATQDAAAGNDEEEETALQGEAGGKEAYKRVQANSVAAVQRQQAARLQVTTTAALFSGSMLYA